MPSRSPGLGAKTLQSLQRRLPFLLLLTAIACVSLFTWRILARITTYEEDSPIAGVEKVVGDKFLGLKIHDQTADRIMQNPYLRLAMNEGFRKADVVRRHQMDEVWLQDGQHPETGEPAVIVVVKPKPHEVPRPPLEPVAIRRWQPEKGKVYDAETVANRQRTRAPNEEDLASIRHVWSGHRYQEMTSLFRSIRRLLAFIVVAMALVLVAGIYRSYAYFATKSDLGAERARADAALGSFKTARAAQRAQEQLDQPGY